MMGQQHVLLRSRSRHPGRDSRSSAFGSDSSDRPHTLVQSTSWMSSSPCACSSSVPQKETLQGLTNSQLWNALGHGWRHLQRPRSASDRSSAVRSWCGKMDGPSCRENVILFRQRARACQSVPAGRAHPEMERNRYRPHRRQVLGERPREVGLSRQEAKRPDQPLAIHTRAVRYDLRGQSLSCPSPATAPPVPPWARR